jgi:hypothetical protein
MFRDTIRNWVGVDALEARIRELDDEVAYLLDPDGFESEFSHDIEQLINESEGRVQRLR